MPGSKSEYDTIKEILDSQEDSDSSQKIDVREELHHIMWTIIHLLGGMLGIYALGTIKLLFSSDLALSAYTFAEFANAVQSYAIDFAIIFAVIGTIWLMGTYGAARSQVIASSRIRAWSNTENHDSNPMIQYFEMVNWGGWIVGYFWAALFVFLIRYLQ